MISVIITSHNRKEYLLDAIKSVLNQTLDKNYYEIIIVKNFEDSIIDKFIEENNIKNILTDKISLSGKIVEALKICNNDIISFLDDDDLFFNNKLEIVNKIFENKDIAYYHNSEQSIDDNNKELNFAYNSLDFNMSSISIRKEIINENTLSKVTHSIDTLMYLFSVNSNKKVYLDKKVLTYYRIHNSITHNFDDLNLYINFNIKSYNNVMNSYKTFYVLFDNKRIKDLLLHKIAFTYFMLRIFNNEKFELKKYIDFIRTKSYNNKKYEYKIMISSIFLKKYIIRKLYNNEVKKITNKI